MRPPYEFFRSHRLHFGHLRGGRRKCRGGSVAQWTWLRLGIGIERIQPAPEQNGSHERMHLTLKKEATKPAAKNFLKQQERFDRFLLQPGAAPPGPGYEIPR